MQSTNDLSRFQTYARFALSLIFPIRFNTEAYCRIRELISTRTRNASLWEIRWCADAGLRLVLDEGGSANSSMARASRPYMLRWQTATTSDTSDVPDSQTDWHLWDS